MIMMVTKWARVLCCWLLLAAACHHCEATSKFAVLPLEEEEEAKSLADGVTSTTTSSSTTQHLLQQQEEEEAAFTVLDVVSTLRRQLQEADEYDNGADNNNNEPNDSNENDPNEEEDEEDDEPNEAGMMTPSMKEKQEDGEVNDVVGGEAEPDDEDEETQEYSNRGNEDVEEEEKEYNYANEDYDIKEPDEEEEPNQQYEGGRSDRQDAPEQEEQQWSGETPPTTAEKYDDDYVVPQQPPRVKFQRPGADKARTYRMDSLTPEQRAKIQMKLDEKNKAVARAGRDRRGFHLQQQQQQQQEPPLRRPIQGQGKAAAIITPENPRAGATDTMRAFQPGTVEYKQRREEVLKRVELTNGKRARLALQLKMDESDKRRAAQNSTSTTVVLISDAGGPGPGNNNKGRYTPYTKALPKAKFVEKVPVVKRLVKKMGYEEALMLDTTLSFLQGLRFGVYKASGPLTLTKKHALVEWFELLSVSLPQEWGIHDILDDFSDNINDISQNESSLAALINKHKPSRTTWSPACNKQQQQGKKSSSSSSSAMSGFSCGFWKLLHVSTVGLAEHRGGKSLIESGIRNAKTTRTFTPKEAAETMKNYIQLFYLCGDCAKKFVAEYNDCTLFSRCNRLADDASVTTDADWKEVGKWLWEVHNHISVKALQERQQNEKKSHGFPTARSASAEQVDVIAALWPTVDTCTQCFNGDGSWNEDAVFLYLERTFWPPSILDPQSARLLKFEDEFGAQGSGLTMILALVGLMLVVVMRQSLSKKSINQTIIMARKAMVTKRSVGAKKRAV